MLEGLLEYVFCRPQWPHKPEYRHTIDDKENMYIADYEEHWDQMILEYEETGIRRTDEAAFIHEARLASLPNEEEENFAWTF